MRNMKIKKQYGMPALMILAWLCLYPSAKINAQNEYDILRDNWLLYTDAPNSLYHYITGQAYGMLASRSDEIAGIGSLKEWQERQQKVRETLLDIIGPFPEKTPLNARVLRTLDMDGFRVEHIVYESQPGFYVTSSLFIPEGTRKNHKTPVVIYCSGHAVDGYRGEVYQHVILNLVKKGFIVFAFDPVGQGERLEYYDPARNESAIGGPTTEHSYPGTQTFITGSSEARYMIWDGIRAVDYLLTRKEIDPSRIGITGRSGGGTQSAYIAAMDDRILAAAPECYISRGIDLGDLLEVRAPKPALMITTTRDFFSIQGAMETEAEVIRIYGAYGRQDYFGRAEDDTVHASTRKNREAMYAFFQKHLDNPGSSKDENVNILSKEEIRVTPTGQVSTSFGGETVFSLNKKEADKLASQLDARRGVPQKYLAGVIESAKRLSGYHEPSCDDNPVFTGRYRKHGYVIEKHLVNGEGNYVIPYLLFIPDKCNGKAIVYLHPSGKSAEAGEGGEIEWFAEKGFTVLAPDIVGTGEMGPGIFRGDAYIEGGSHNLWYASILIGRSVVGIRAGDVSKLVCLLEDRKEIDHVYGISRKEMAPVLLHAAAFNTAIERIALVEPYSSYLSIVRNHYYSSSFIPGVVPGALREYDLPDITASLAPRRLMMAGVTDGNGRTSDGKSIDDDLSFIKSCYSLKNAGDELCITPLDPDTDLKALFTWWIK
jgi:cephalosporin-C deacetylase-like acetyl esterase